MDSMIDKDEFCQLLKDQEAIKALRHVGVDPVGLADMTDQIYADAGEGGLSFEKMIKLSLSLGGSYPATVKDVVDLRVIIMCQLEDLREAVKHQWTTLVQDEQVRSGASQAVQQAIRQHAGHCQSGGLVPPAAIQELQQVMSEMKALKGHLELQLQVESKKLQSELHHALVLLQVSNQISQIASLPDGSEEQMSKERQLHDVFDKVSGDNQRLQSELGHASDHLRELKDLKKQQIELQEWHQMQVKSMEQQVKDMQEQLMEQQAEPERTAV